MQWQLYCTHLVKLVSPCCKQWPLPGLWHRKRNLAQGGLRELAAKEQFARLIAENKLTGGEFVQ